MLLFMGISCFKKSRGHPKLLDSLTSWLKTKIIMKMKPTEIEIKVQIKPGKGDLRVKYTDN